MVMSSINKFHCYIEEKKLWEKTRWFGVPSYKWPPDMLIIQELIFRLEPDHIIETGTAYGGSALFYASVMEMMGRGNVITCDIEKKHNLEDHYMKNITKRISFIEGDSTDIKTIKQIKDLVGGTKKNIVILDSWHSCCHVLQEIGIYESFVGEGFMLIIEDTHAGKPGHPVEWKYDDGGAYEAVKFFLSNNDDFIVDNDCEKFMLTFNPSGYLRRIK